MQITTLFDSKVFISPIAICTHQNLMVDSYVTAHYTPPCLEGVGPLSEDDALVPADMEKGPDTQFPPW